MGMGSGKLSRVRRWSSGELHLLVATHLLLGTGWGGKGLEIGGKAQVNFLHVQGLRPQTRLQNKYHPESSENRAVWKSNNQRFKEATFIQMGRRGRDVEMCREIQRCQMADRYGDTGRVVLHPYVMDKNREGYLRSKGSQPQIRAPSSGFQHQEDKSP